ncbi:unnamed protein product, partial [Effrenium voratum]
TASLSAHSLFREKARGARPNLPPLDRGNSRLVPRFYPSKAADPRVMQIFIKTLTGRKTNFNFELDNTVRHVKEALQEKEGIQVEQIRLIYSGKQMSDECTLNDYNVKPGSTVHMVLQLRGGNL